MQDLIYGIWKNDKAKRKAIWEDVMNRPSTSSSE